MERVKVFAQSACTYLALACLSWHACAAAETDFPWQYRSIAQLRMPDCSGSGTLIGTSGDRALVLSCRHVCESVGRPVEATWVWADNQRTTGQVIDVLRGGGFNTDLALADVGLPKGVQPVEVAVLNLDSGPWAAAGFRQGTMRITTARRGWVNDNMFFFDTNLIGGMSGGPVFNRYGQLVAVGVGSHTTEVKAIGVDGKALQAIIVKWANK